MAVTNLPRSVFLDGSDLTGSDGDTSRTTTLPDSSIVNGSLQIFASGVLLEAGATRDYTYAAGTDTITFIGPIWDDQPISIYYFIQTTTAATTTDYGTVLELARFMCIEGKIPDVTIEGADRSKETVGTGDNSTANFFLDKAGVLTDSYTIEYGSDENTTTTLSETTDFTINKDLGKITLTSGGITAVSTATIFASYSYGKFGINDTQMQDALTRAAERIDQETNTHFADGSVATPDYKVVTEEKHIGKGQFDRDYFTNNRIIPDISTTTSTTATSSTTALTVASTNGFPSSGVIGTGTEKISYTGKDSTTFTGVTGISGTVNTSSTIKPYVVEISSTSEGGSPTWDVLSENQDFDLDLTSGRVRIMRNTLNTSTSDTIYLDTSPLYHVPNRMRVSYIWGKSTIPDDIKLATLMMASKDLMHKIVRKSTMEGLNDFNPTLVDVDNDDIKRILDAYRFSQIENI